MVTSAVNSLSTLTPYPDFRGAASAAMEYLKHGVGLPFWMLAGINEEDWIVLHSIGEGFTLREGDVIDFKDSMMARMVGGNCPRIAPDVSKIPEYAAAPTRTQFGIAAFVAIPILREDGSLFGAISAFDSKAHSDSLATHAKLFDLISRMLGTVLDEELSASDSARRAQLAEVRGLIDQPTGLQNRRAFELFVEQEEDRCKRHAHRATVFIIGIEFPATARSEEREEAMVRAGNALKLALRRHDFVARISPNQFAIVAVEGNSEEIGRIRALVSSAFVQAGLKAKIGVAARHPSTGIKYAWQIAEKEMLQGKVSTW